MAFKIGVPGTLFIGLSIISICESRWNILDRNGHRIRHNRYWKLQFSEQDISKPVCTPLSNSFDTRSCPWRHCRSDNDCLIGNVRDLRCICDKALCGQVCVSRETRCVQLKAPDNGRITLSHDSLPGSTASFQCDYGFKLQGLTNLYCQANGLWSGETPQCIPQVFCPPPPVISNTRIDFGSKKTNFVAGDTVAYKCSKGFITEDFDSRAICDRLGRWIKPPIRCEPISCGHPGIITNGRLDGKEFFYQRKVTFVCNEGYRLDCGQFSTSHNLSCGERVCQANGQWSGILPICRQHQCPSLRPPDNGHMRVRFTNLTSIVLYSCNPGYLLNGSRTRQCHQYGNWTGRPVSCEVIDCGPPPLVPQSRVNFTDTIYGSSATYRCISKSNSLGRMKTIECDKTGRWNPEPVICQQNCSPLDRETARVQNLKNDNIWEITTPVNDDCPEGYLLRSPLFPFCRNGSWSLSTLCQPRPCSTKLPMEPNSQVYFYSLEHGASAFYTCTLGYMRTSGKNISRCQYGQWTGVPLKCELSTCARPSIPDNGKVYLVGLHGRWLYSVSSIRVLHNDTIEYQCDAGYSLEGQLSARCVHGEWYPSKIPICKPLSQRNPPDQTVLP